MKKAKPWIKVLGFIAGLAVILMVCDFVLHRLVMYDS